MSEASRWRSPLPMFSPCGAAGLAASDTLPETRVQIVKDW